MRERILRALKPVIVLILTMSAALVIGYRILFDDSDGRPVELASEPRLRDLPRRIALRAAAVVSAPINLAVLPLALAGFLLATAAGLSPRGRAARAVRRGTRTADEATALWIAHEREDQVQLLIGLALSAVMGGVVGAMAAAASRLTPWRNHGAVIAILAGVTTATLGALAFTVFGTRAFDAWSPVPGAAGGSASPPATS